MGALAGTSAGPVAMVVTAVLAARTVVVAEMVVTVGLAGRMVDHAATVEMVHLAMVVGPVVMVVTVEVDPITSGAMAVKVEPGVLMVDLVAMVVTVEVAAHCVAVMAVTAVRVGVNKGTLVMAATGAQVRPKRVMEERAETPAPMDAAAMVATVG